MSELVWPLVHLSVHFDSQKYLEVADEKIQTRKSGGLVLNARSLYFPTTGGNSERSFHPSPSVSPLEGSCYADMLLPSNTTGRCGPTVAPLAVYSWLTICDYIVMVMISTMCFCTLYLYSSVWSRGGSQSVATSAT